ncbi:hypothetical protein R1sor_024333 [Riccia sorocarpa]|uniref:rRNA methyltransferase 1, mitochondrial n=1 Tax=Riccia sorocarpa TaxID=122646 RepID=A0ABD3GQ82_9MARC
MSLSIGRQLCLQPRLAVTVARQFHKCRSEIQWPNLQNFSSSRDQKISRLSRKCLRAFTTQAAANRRERDVGETSWDKAAEHYFNEGVVTSSERAVADYGNGGSEDSEVRPQKRSQTPFRQERWERSHDRGLNSQEDRRGYRVSSEEDLESQNRVSDRRQERSEWDGAENDSSRPVGRFNRGLDRTRRDTSGTFKDRDSSSSSGSSRRPISFRERSSAATSEQQWQRSRGRPPPREEFKSRGEYRSDARNYETKGYDRMSKQRGRSSWREGAAERPQEQRFGGGEGDDWRWQAREPSPPLEMEGQAVYGVAPIVSALQACRRTFYTLYMQENLAQNLMTGKRKDKQAVAWIQRKVKSLGVTVKEASKHDLNLLVDNRPHQGLVLDASPLELVPIDALDAPNYHEGRAPVWVALDEITDPQNFGAVLRSAYFLGADGVVVCAKNSAPLSGVVSKASAGALEVMDVQYCRSMIKFLDKSRERGWRILGGASEASSVPIRDVSHGVATILVLGNEGRGMRTMVKRSCDQLVSIVGNAGNVATRIDSVYDHFSEEDDEVEDEDNDDADQEIRSGAELDVGSGPMAVDSLNVSVAAGILLHELIIPGNQTGNAKYCCVPHKDKDGLSTLFRKEIQGENMSFCAG